MEKMVYDSFAGMSFQSQNEVRHVAAEYYKKWLASKRDCCTEIIAFWSKAAGKRLRMAMRFIGNGVVDATSGRRLHKAKKNRQGRQAEASAL